MDVELESQNILQKKVLQVLSGTRLYLVFTIWKNVSDVFVLYLFG